MFRVEARPKRDSKVAARPTVAELYGSAPFPPDDYVRGWAPDIRGGARSSASSAPVSPGLAISYHDLVRRSSRSDDEQQRNPGEEVPGDLNPSTPAWRAGGSVHNAPTGPLEPPRTDLGGGPSTDIWKKRIYPFANVGSTDGKSSGGADPYGEATNIWPRKKSRTKALTHDPNRPTKVGQEAKTAKRPPAVGNAERPVGAVGQNTRTRTPPPSGSTNNGLYGQNVQGDLGNAPTGQQRAPQIPGSWATDLKKSSNLHWVNVDPTGTPRKQRPIINKDFWASLDYNQPEALTQRVRSGQDTSRWPQRAQKSIDTSTSSSADVYSAYDQAERAPSTQPGAAPEDVRRTIPLDEIFEMMRGAPAPPKTVSLEHVLKEMAQQASKGQNLPLPGDRL